MKTIKDNGGENNATRGFVGMPWRERERPMTWGRLDRVDLRSRTHTDALVLLPVHLLVLGATVPHQLTLAANLRRNTLAIIAPVAAARLAAGALAGRRRLLLEADVAVDPVAHGSRPYALAVLAAPSHAQNAGGIDSTPGESYHLAVLGAAGIGAAGRVVVEDRLVGDEGIMREEYLGVGRRLMREQHDEARLLLVQDGAQSEVDLGEAWGAPLLEEGMRESDIWERRRLVGGKEEKGSRHIRSACILCAMDGLHVRPYACLQTSLKYSVTSSISCRFRSVTMMKISSQPISCIPRRIINSGSCARAC